MKKTVAQKRANDKLHPDNLGETKDVNDLAFDEEEQSYTFDVKAEDKSYDHPLPYNSVSKGAVDDDSTYDEANPYVGDEYAEESGGEEDSETSEEPGMHIDEDGESIRVNAEDHILGLTEEDFRDDLDEEGYPKNDAP